MANLKQTGRRAIHVAIVAISSFTLAMGQWHNPKVEADLEGKDPAALLNVIIQYKQGAQQRNTDAVVSRGGRSRYRLDLVRSASYSVRASALDELANDPDVESIVPDRPVYAAGAALTPDYKLQTVYADIAQQSGWNGNGIGVAVIDSGIADKPDLHGSSGYRVVYAENFIKGGSAVDTNSHGTHVAGIIGGTGGQSSGVYTGVAPNVNIINLMVLDKDGTGTDSVVIAAIQRAIQLKTQYNIRVINLSLGRPVAQSYKTDPLCQAAEAAWKAGIVVVVSAGNEGRNNSANTNGYATISAPGNDPYVITVGAMKPQGTASRADDRIASYSSKGPTLLDHIVKPDLVAPGNKIVSILGAGTLANKYKTNVTASAYFILNGTSMAAPMVSGAVALILQQNPNLTPDQVKARLMKTASKSFPSSSVATDPVTGATYTSYYDPFTIGAGYLDIWAALNSADTAAGTALSPVAVYNPLNHTVSISNISGQNVIWGSNVIWGDNVIWGTNILSGTNVIWGNNVIWGDSTTQGFNVIWGSNVIWGAGAPASESTAVAINGEN